MSRKMMVVIAHPDDECYAFGGALGLAKQQGVETYVICLTDGQAATNRGDAASSAELGRIRRAELAASCKVLGVAHHELLEYQDAQLEFINFSRAAGQLVERMRRFKPDVVVTFGQDGGLNTHADHTMVSALATAAFHWSGRVKRYHDAGPVWQPKRLFHVSSDFFLPNRQEPLPLPWTVVLDVRNVFALKMEAFHQHASQIAVLVAAREMFEKHGHNEFYTLMAEAGVKAARPMTSFFEGLPE